MTPPPEPELPPISREEAIATFWHYGDLEYLLRDVQKDMRAAIVASPETVFVVECSRRLGKSFLACLLCVEHALQAPESQIRFLAPTKSDLRKIITPILSVILKDCPPHLRPVYNAQDSVWNFPNKSQLHLAGVNGDNADNLRGTATDLLVVDEAGFVDELSYLVKSVVGPAVTERDGRIILISTPPKTPAHDFNAFVVEAVQCEAYFKRTIFDAAHITERQRDLYCRRAGGAESTDWRREYLLEHVADSDTSVLPEFANVKTDVVVPHAQLLAERPRCLVPIVVGDVGYKDFTFILLGYYDFRKGLDVIEAEIVVKNTIASDISKLVEAKALELWGPELYRLGGLTFAQLLQQRHNPPKTNIRHYADCPPIVINELGSHWSGIAKTQTNGPYMESAVNDLRTRLQNKSVRISDGCKQLLAHLEYAIWDKSKTDFARMQNYGHFDGVAAAAYFTKLLDRHTNPYPFHEPGTSKSTHWLQEEPSSTAKNLSLPFRMLRKQKLGK